MFDRILYYFYMADRGKVLITGGTSGLGLELVRVFLSKGYYVIATGRRIIEMPGFKDSFRLFRVDFADLRNTAGVFRQICNLYDPDLVIYNAGVLSPSLFTRTIDGFEYTYQVNFLAHFLANEIILMNHDRERPLRISAVTSMAYRVAEPDFKPVKDSFSYSAIRAYSTSKLYLALMCRYYAGKFAGRATQFCSFDPGVFSSQLYRTQSGIFRKIYQSCVNILRKPTLAAEKLSEILRGSEIKNGAVYDVRGRIRKLREPESSASEVFWTNVRNDIYHYLG